jgi:hypothetical protein
MFDLEKIECVKVGRHVYPRTVVLETFHNTNPIRRVGLVQCGHYYIERYYIRVYREYLAACH